MSKIDFNKINEIYETPYRKKKKKKTVKKADHKHKFIPFIGHTKCDVLGKIKDQYIIAEECSICGRRQVKNYFITIPSEKGHFSTMTNNLEEIKKLYPNYEVKEYPEKLF